MHAGGWIIFDAWKYDELPNFKSVTDVFMGSLHMTAKHLIVFILLRGLRSQVSGPQAVEFR